MNRMKKIVVWLLVLTLLLGLSACAKSSEKPQTTPPEQQPTEEKTDENNVEQPAEPETEREHVTLKFYQRVSEQPDQEVVFAELNKYFEEEFHTTVEWQFLGGTYNDKISVIINSGEEYDACFTSDWKNPYLTNVSRGAFLDLTDMLADYPDLYQTIPEDFWEAVKVDGRIYGVPNQQIAARSPALVLNNEYMNAFGWTAEDMGKVEKLLDLEEYAQFCLDQYGAKFYGVEAANMAQYCGYETLNGPAGAVAIKIGDPEAKVVNLYETEEFKNLCQEMAELYAKGLTNPELLLDTSLANNEIMAGRVSGYIKGTYKPGGSEYATSQYSLPLTMAALGEPILTTSGITATMWGISTTSKHPDRALEIIEALETDPYVLMTIAFGLEGVHYDIVDGFMVKRPDSGYSVQDWSFGNVFLGMPEQGTPADVWTQTAELNASADRSVLLGFSYSIDNVEAEATNISNVYATYMAVITGELPVEETLEEFNSKLKVAGIDDVIADAQAQIDAFLGK